MERSTGLRSPRPDTAAFLSPRPALGKRRSKGKKVLQTQGKPPPATSPTSIGNGGTSLHTMRGARGGGGEGGNPGGGGEVKGEKKTYATL